jgi:hypothetical protein
VDKKIRVLDGDEKASGFLKSLEGQGSFKGFSFEAIN